MYELIHNPHTHMGLIQPHISRSIPLFCHCLFPRSVKLHLFVFIWKNKLAMKTTVQGACSLKFVRNFVHKFSSNHPESYRSSECIHSTIPQPFRDNAITSRLFLWIQTDVLYTDLSPQSPDPMWLSSSQNCYCEENKSEITTWKHQNDVNLLISL